MRHASTDMDQNNIRGRGSELLTDAALASLFGVALIYSLSNFFAHCSDVLLDQHSFRQTQTALSAYWLLRDGFRLAYLTPVIGSPWSVPLELPLFQILTAYVAKLGGLHLDTAGRAVSYFFCIATLWPIWMLGRVLQLRKRFFLIAGTLYLASPLYLFWGKAFLIETLAVFLTLLFLVFAIRILLPVSSPARPWTLVLGMAISGLLAANTKVTTFAPAALAAASLLAVHAWKWWRSNGWSARKCLKATWLYVLFALGLIYVSISLWVSFTDKVKSQGEISRLLTSARLYTWNFGTLSERLSATLWSDTIASRAVVEAIGPSILLIIGVAAVRAYRWREAVYASCAVVLFLTTFLLFPNLHIQHNYYQCANAIYLILGAAVILSSMGSSKRVAMVCVVAVVMALQIQTFRAGYQTLQATVADPLESRTLQVANAVRNSVGKDAAIMVFGYDWSAEIAYYSERRAVTVPNWGDLPSKVAEQPERFLGGVPLGGVVVCPEADSSERFRNALAHLTNGAREERQAGCVIFTELMAGSPQVTSK